MNQIEIEHVSKSFTVKNQTTAVLQDVSLQVQTNQFVSVLGPSGCGKSTLFNMICGLVPVDSGRILLAGQQGRTRELLSYMPQKDLLLPWRRIIDNVILPLQLAGVKRCAAVEEALALMDIFGLKGFENHYPTELSGGMRQRAALMRTFLTKKEIMLLDEPFGALDAITRFKMQTWLLKIWQRFCRTILFITHDVDEAIYLSDKIYVFTERPGRIKLETDVPLPRPRYPELITGSEFVEIKKTVLSALK